jgi:hypothetical protein
MECDMELTIGTVMFGEVSQLSSAGPVIALHDCECADDDSRVIEVLARSEEELKVGDAVLATCTEIDTFCRWKVKKIHEI